MKNTEKIILCMVFLYALEACSASSNRHQHDGVVTVSEVTLFSIDHDTDDNAPHARSLLAGRSYIEGLIQKHGDSNFLLKNILKSPNWLFICQESKKHPDYCACDGSTFLNIQQLLESAIYCSQEILMRREDVDLNVHAVLDPEDSGSLYNCSKAEECIPYKLEQLAEKYNFRAVEIKRRLIGPKAAQKKGT
jgi:hypothetical protein